MLPISGYGKQFTIENILSRYDNFKQLKSFFYNGQQLAILTEVSLNNEVTAEDVVNAYDQFNRLQLPLSTQVANAELVRASYHGKLKNLDYQDIADIYNIIYAQKKIWHSGNQIAILTTAAIANKLPADFVVSEYTKFFNKRRSWKSGAQVAELTRIYLSQKTLTKDQILKVYQNVSDEFSLFSSEGQYIAILADIAMQKHLDPSHTDTLFKYMDSTQFFWSSNEQVAELSRLLL